MSPFEFIIHSLSSKADPTIAIGQEAYMKHHFKFFGVNTTSRRIIYKDLKNNFKLTELDNSFFELINVLWKEEHRECQYMAIDLMHSNSKKFDASHLPYLESLIIHKSWWDSVDGIAPHLVGAVFNKNKDEILHWIQKWMNSDNIWLQRSAIIFQLKYGKATDWDLLCTAILRHDASTEFFVRKAQGWALRQYSKYEPQLVLSFVQANPQLSGLTKREALRKII